jgi:hypothetical protein
VHEKKTLEADVVTKRKLKQQLQHSSRRFGQRREKIKTPILAEIENILMEHNICAAAYHGGKLNGVDCRELIQLAKLLFRKIQNYLLSTEKALDNLDYMWKMAKMNFTPKLHCLLVHAIYHMRLFEWIGDTLEDDMEHMHQISARIEAQLSHMKDKDKQALVHSKMEAIQFNVEVTEKIEQFNT